MLPESNGGPISSLRYTPEPQGYSSGSVGSPSVGSSGPAEPTGPTRPGSFYEPSHSNPVKKAVLILLVVIGLGLAGFLGFKVYQNRGGILSYSGLAVDVKSGSADVYVDGEKLGQTPFESKSIRPGTRTVKVQKDNLSYETSVEFNPNSQVVINRDLGVSKTFSSGQNFWLDSKDLSSKLNVISSPSDATVFIDDAEVGKTPFTSAILTDGEYDLKIQKDGYEAQTARIKIQKGLKLNVSVQLFLLPVSEKLVAFSGSKMVYDLSSDLNDLILDIPSWVKGVNYVTTTRGNSVRFSYYVDYQGSIYDSEGRLQAKESKFNLKAGDTIGYLGRRADNGLTDSAKAAMTSFVGVDIGGGKKVKVLNTPTGWLRVRSAPNLTGEEVAKVNVGDILPVLEEKTGWTRITTQAGKEGWISSAYIQEAK